MGPVSCVTNKEVVMKLKNIAIVLLIGLVTLSSPIALAQKGSGGKGGKGGDIAGMPRGRWWNNAEITKQINLTETQKEEIQKIMIDHQKVILDFNNEASKFTLDFDQAMEATNFNAGTAENLLEKIQDYRAKSQLERGKMFIKFREVLSQDQYLKLKSIKGKRGGKRGDKGGQKGHKRGGQSGKPGPSMERGQRQGQGPGKQQGTCPYGSENCWWKQ